MNTDIQRINAATRYCDAAIHNGVAYFAGTVPETTGGLGIEEQTREVLALIDGLLATVGSHKSRILNCQIFLKDIADIGGMNAVWDAWVEPGHPPARATVQAALGDPGWRIEIVLNAALNG